MDLVQFLFIVFDLLARLLLLFVSKFAALFIIQPISVKNFVEFIRYH